VLEHLRKLRPLRTPAVEAPLRHVELYLIVFILTGHPCAGLGSGRVRGCSAACPSPIGWCGIDQPQGVAVAVVHRQGQQVGVGELARLPVSAVSQLQLVRSCPLVPQAVDQLQIHRGPWDLQGSSGKPLRCRHSWPASRSSSSCWVVRILTASSALPPHCSA
jgi:hypothetical protein